MDIIFKMSYKTVPMLAWTSNPFPPFSIPMVGSLENSMGLRVWWMVVGIVKKGPKPVLNGYNIQRSYETVPILAWASNPFPPFSIHMVGSLENSMGLRVWWMAVSIVKKVQKPVLNGYNIQRSCKTVSCMLFLQ